MSRRQTLVLVSFALLLALAALLRMLVGGTSLAWPENADILSLRTGRVVSGIVVGAALAVAGAMLQSLLRNPLASPDLLGLAPGAGLALTLWAWLGSLGSGSLAPGYAATAPAVAGALGALAIVYVVSQKRGLVDPVSLVLVGVIVSIVCGSLTTLVQHMLPDRGMAVARWMLGTLKDEVPTSQIWFIGGLVAAGTGIGAWLGPAMDAASLSDDEAHSVGVPLARLRMTLFLMSGVLTAGAVVLAGPIGFVGLVCPHIVRLTAGPSHRVLIIGSALCGAGLIVSADTFVKSVLLPSGRLPVGVITSILGGPVFLLLLRRSR